MSPDPKCKKFRFKIGRRLNGWKNTYMHILLRLYLKKGWEANSWWQFSKYTILLFKKSDSSSPIIFLFKNECQIDCPVANVTSLNILSSFISHPQVACPVTGPAHTLALFLPRPSHGMQQGIQYLAWQYHLVPLGRGKKEANQPPTLWKKAFANCPLAIVEW